MGLQTQVTEEELNEVFADTSDKGASFCGILVSYRKMNKQEQNWEFHIH